MISKLDEEIYNAFIKISRQVKDQPYRRRKDFGDFQDTDKFIYLKRVSSILGKFKHINADDYFMAPYHIYGKDQYFDLQFYASLKAVKAYNEYQKSLQNESPDSQRSIDSIRASFTFIWNFCKDNNIPIEEYITSKKEDDMYNYFVYHLKEHRVNIYTLFSFPDFENELKKLNQDELEYIIPIIAKLAKYRTQFASSSKAKQFTNTAYNILNSRQLKIKTNNI